MIAVIRWFRSGSWADSIRDLFAAKPVVIDDTPVLVKEINELAQLCTITSYDEVVVDSIKPRSGYKQGTLSIANALQMFGPEQKLVLIAKGKIIAGTDLKKLTAEDFFIEKDSISITVPEAEILDVIMNPGDFETFIEEGVWNNDAVTAVKVKARNQVIVRAMEQNILHKATTRSIAMLENFLRNVGYNRIHLVVKQ